MTAPRGKIEASLAERGRPAMWANEQEAAALSGMGVELFRAKVTAWEKRGFPQVNPENGRRFIPAIINFWACQVDSIAAARPESGDEGPDGPEVENFGHGTRSQRRSA